MKPMLALDEADAAVIKAQFDRAARAGFNSGWFAAIDEAAAVAGSYPEGYGPEHAAAGLIRRGQDDAAREIAAAIRALNPRADAENATPPSPRQEAECRPNSGFDSRDGGQPALTPRHQTEDR